MTMQTTTAQDAAESAGPELTADAQFARVKLFEQIDRSRTGVTTVAFWDNGRDDLFVTGTDGEFRRLEPAVHRQIDRCVIKEAHAYAEATYGPRSQWPQTFTVERPTAAEAAEAYTEEEVEKATALFIEHMLKPAAQRTGRSLGDLFEDVSDDLFGAWVLAFMMAGREVESGAAEPTLVTRAGVIFVGALRKLPGREELAAAAVGGIYRAARAAAGIQ